MSNFPPSDETNEPDNCGEELSADLIPEPVIVRTLATGDMVGTLDDISVSIESRSDRLKRIGKPLASFFGVQIIVQILTMISGLLLVRTMSKSEYAFYTIANSMQGAINLLGDSGIGSALTAIGGVVWQDKQRFGELIQTALEFRKKFGIAIFATVGPIMWWLLYSNGASVGYALLISGVVLAGAGLSLVHGVLIVVPRLHARVSQLQNAELILAASRLAIIGIACFTFLNAFVALLIVFLTLSLQNILYRRWAAIDADLKAAPNPQDREKIWKTVRSQAPSVFFYCIQGQISVVIIGLFGSTTAVANLGALGRITIFFTILSSLMANVVLPRFARCQTRVRIRKMYIQIVGCYFAATTLFSLTIILLAHKILSILGSKYAGLENELIYLTLGAVAAAMTGVLYSLNATKGWLEGTWITIPLTLAIQISVLPFLNLGSIRDVVILGVAQPLAAAVVSIGQAIHAFRTMDESGLTFR